MVEFLVVFSQDLVFGILPLVLVQKEQFPMDGKPELPSFGQPIYHILLVDADQYLFLKIYLLLLVVRQRRVYQAVNMQLVPWIFRVAEDY